MKIDIKWFQLSMIKLLKLFLENKDTTQVNEVFYLGFPSDLVTFTEEILHGKLFVAVEPATTFIFYEFQSQKEIFSSEAHLTQYFAQFRKQLQWRRKINACNFYHGTEI